jgi:hypothetical protein
MSKKIYESEWFTNRLFPHEIKDKNVIVTIINKKVIEEKKFNSLSTVPEPKRHTGKDLVENSCKINRYLLQQIIN